MKLQEITNKNIWEKFILKNSPQSFFQCWNWGEVIIKSQKSKVKSQKYVRYGLYKNNKLLGIAGAEIVRAKRGKFLHIRHGPIFSKWKLDYIKSLFSQIKKIAKDEKCVFIRTNPLITDSEKNRTLFKKIGFFNSNIHALDAEYCWVLDLNKSLDVILYAMRKTTRNLIRKGQKMDIKIKKTTDEKYLKEFLDLYHKTAKRHDFVPHKSIREEFNQFVKDGQMLLFNGYYKDQLLSSAMIIFYNHQAIYHHSCSVQQKVPVNYLLQWEVIKEAQKRGKSIYNFWGIAPEEKKNHPWKGLTLFKKGFGGKVEQYLHTKDLPLSSLYCATYLLELYTKLKKGY